MLSGHDSLYFSAVVSMPFVPGHEVVGELLDDCEDLPKRHPRRPRPGADLRRPWCRAVRRAARPAAPTGATGSPSATSRPGLQTGFCTDTGGGWGEQLIAHRSQLHAVPDGLSDEQARADRAARRARCTPRCGPRCEPATAVLVSGAGAVGLFATLALRELTQAGEITVVAKHGHQRDLARAFGATDVVAPDEVLRGVRRSTGAFQLKPELRRAPYLLGGVDVAVDAVGSKQSLETALHATRAGGRVVLSGMPAAGADLSPAWFRELEVVGTYASARRGPNGRPAFDIALELAGRAPLDGIVGARYPLHRWREALDHAQSAGRLGTVKVSFDVRSTA